MELQILDIINVLTPVFAGVIGWFVGRRKQRNDFLTDLQASVDLLAEKNRLQMEEIIKLREELAKNLKENILLRAEIETLNSRLENVTITKSKS